MTSGMGFKCQKREQFSLSKLTNIRWFALKAGAISNSRNSSVYHTNARSILIIPRARILRTHLSQEVGHFTVISIRCLLVYCDIKGKRNIDAVMKQINVPASIFCEYTMNVH